MNRALIFALGFIPCCFAAAPASLGNHVYYEEGRTTARNPYQLAIVLEPGGIARGLYLVGSSVGSATPTAGAAPSGTWTYRIVNDRTAELTITAGGASGPYGGPRTLTFSRDRDGEVNSLVVSAGTFQLSPTNERSPLVNCSNRAHVPAGGAAFTGFVITGERRRTVLIRAVGPGLEHFGVAATLANPRLNLTQRGQVIAQNDDWGADVADAIRSTSAYVGAFPLQANSRDAAVIVTLGPGDYVAEAVADTATAVGQVLVEVYMLP